MSKCPNCGADLVYDVNSTSVTCGHCKSSFDPKQLNVKTKSAKEREMFSGKSYNCSSCGATLLTFDETAITFCSYCGSQSMIESKMVKQNNPDFIIPFKKTKEECIENYKRKLKKSLFIPDYMKSDIVVEKFRGIYMPYCIYKTSLHGKCSNHGVKSYRRGDYVYYDDYDITAQVDADIDGISCDMISKFYDRYSTSIPFDYNEIEDFNKNYLMGFYADTKDIDNTLYDQFAEKISEETSTKYLSKKSEFSKYGCSNPKAKLNVTNRKIGMFPIYFLAIRDKDNKNVHYAVINGQTGKVAADLPIDFKKYIIGSLILSIVLFAIINFYLTIIPTHIIWFSFISAVISIIISNIQLNKLYIKEHNLDDIGYLSKNNVEEMPEVENEQNVKKKKTKNEMKFKDKFKYLYKQLIAIGLIVAVIIINPVEDAYYYVSSIASLVLIVFSFVDLVKEHNLLTKNKLPQLEKRGGDENE